MRRERLDAEGRRQAIVEAAKPLFAAGGFAGTTTRRIAHAAGVSEALLFQHFPSKAALYREILRCGCEGDPALARLATRTPSTATLVGMVRGMLRHIVLGELAEPGDRQLQHRLMLNSFLEDGDYARQMCGWVVERIQPLFDASLEAAARAGDLRPGARPRNAFWLAQHVAAMIAYARLGTPCAVPYRGSLDEVLEDAQAFMLRGIGLTDEAIARHPPEPGPGGCPLAAADLSPAQA